MTGVASVVPAAWTAQRKGSKKSSKLGRALIPEIPRAQLEVQHRHELDACPGASSRASGVDPRADGRESDFGSAWRDAKRAMSGASRRDTAARTSLVIVGEVF